jgi:hypothetical protein
MKKSLSVGGKIIVENAGNFDQSTRREMLRSASARARTSASW